MPLRSDFAALLLSTCARLPAQTAPSTVWISDQGDGTHEISAAVIFGPARSRKIGRMKSPLS